MTIASLFIVYRIEIQNTYHYSMVLVTQAMFFDMQIMRRMQKEIAKWRYGKKKEISFLISKLQCFNA